MLENIRLSFQGIWSHKMRSFLTMLGIIIGIAAIIAIVSTIKGTNEQIKQNLIGSGDNSVTVQLYKGDSSYETEYYGIPEGVPVITSQVLSEIRSVDKVKDATVYVSRDSYNTIFHQNTGMSGGRIYGIEKDYFDVCSYIVKNGRVFDDADFKNFRKVAVLDEDSADTLFAGEDPVGKTIEIRQEPYTVIGVVTKSSKFEPVITSMEDYYMYAQNNSGMVYVPYATWPAIYGYDEPQNLVLTVNRTEDMTVAGKKSAEVLNSYLGETEVQYKAIDLLDEAASRVRLHSFTAPPDVKEQEDRLKALQNEKKEAIAHQDFEKAASLRDEERKLRQDIAQKRAAWEERKNNSHDVVTEEDIAQIVASWTGVPVKKMTEDESQRLLHMEELLHKRVVGQDEAISAVSRALRRARAGLQDPKRPIGSFIFLGPTGVGKTELCRALGEVMFDDENALIRIDMSEYMEKHSVSRLVGSPPGYVGYEEGGQLTQKVRNKPYSVVLFDEVEKAHPDVFNILLQILDDGRLTDSNGRVVNFKNTIIVMTSNAGASTITSKRSLGFGGSVETTRDYEAMKERVMAEVKDTFRPEFINRIDDLIVFHALEPDDIRRIAGLMLGSVSKRLAQRGMKLSYGDDVIALLAEEGYDPNYGARPLRRTIQRSVEDALSEEIIAGKIALGDQVQLYVDDNKHIAFRKLLPQTPAQPAPTLEA